MSAPALRAPDDVLVHLRRARDHADRSYSRSITLEEMAAVACLSKYHFLRLFKSTYGVTPMEYVSRRRIERAQDQPISRSRPATSSKRPLTGADPF